MTARLGAANSSAKPIPWISFIHATDAQARCNARPSGNEPRVVRPEPAARAGCVACRAQRFRRGAAPRSESARDERRPSAPTANARRPVARTQRKPDGGYPACRRATTPDHARTRRHWAGTERGCQVRAGHDTAPIPHRRQRLCSARVAGAASGAATETGAARDP